MRGRLPAIVEVIWSRISNRIIGRVDGERGDRFCGWAFDRSNPRRRLTILILSGEATPIYELADRYRADVQQSGIGDGYCGFSVPLHRFDGLRDISVFCDSPRIELRGLAASRRSKAGPESTTCRHGTYIVQFNKISGRTIDGWALDSASPETRRRLSLWGDGQIVAEQRAALYRPELVGPDRDGFHGFSLMLPDRRPGSLILEDAGAGLMFPLKQ